MNSFKLEQLQQCAIHSVMARASEANTASLAYRMGDVHSLHIAAHMDIDKTTESLKDVLKYKKEAAEQMLRCSGEKRCELLANVIKQADDMVLKLLGVYVP